MPKQSELSGNYRPLGHSRQKAARTDASPSIHTKGQGSRFFHHLQKPLYLRNARTPRAGSSALEGLTLYLRFEQQVLLGHLPYGVKVRAKVPGVPHFGLGSPMRKRRETGLMAATAGGRHGLLAQCTTLVSSPGSATYQLVSRGSHVTAPSLTVLL